MSVLDREALAASPLADLHLIASELGVDGFRRMRREQLVDAILAHQGDGAPPGGGDDAAPSAPAATEEEQGAEDEEEEEAEPRRGRRRGRRRARADQPEPEPAAETAAPAAPEDEEGEEPLAEGTVELLGNGSAFLRVSPPDPSDDDVYVSAAQVRRCELVSGDRVSGPVRPARRSERYPSLVRVATINGRPAEEVAEGTRFEDLPAAFPTERLELDADDPTLKAIEWLTPFGKGSRVAIVGPARAGKSEAVRRLAATLAGRDGLELAVVLAGVRPEEVGEWADGPVAPAAVATLGASADAQAQAVERALEPAKRIAARGGDAVLLVDRLDGLPEGAARRLLAAARNIVDGGSLTVVATAAAPLGGETTVIVLDIALASTARFPALDLPASGTLRPELLVGGAGAEAIARARADALG